MPKPQQDSRYWTLPIRGIVKAQSELPGQKVNVLYFYYDKYSEASFNKVTREVLQTKLDGLLIAPVLSSAFEKFVRALPAPLPYVFFDSFIPNVNYISYIGQDSFQSGRLSARLMQMIIKGAGVVAVIKVLPEDYHINDRVSGFLTYCRHCPEVQAKVYELDGHREARTRLRTFAQILTENADLKGIFVSNATTHQIADYIRSNSLQEKVHVIGYDLIDENIRGLKDGVIDFLISQQSERQGYEGLYALYRHVVLREKVEKNVMMQLDIATKENIDYYRS
ncbi:MAG: sugar ABC transporter substrate-binding protein [Candidatus Aminicenantales bacterium]